MYHFEKKKQESDNFRHFQLASILGGRRTVPKKCPKKYPKKVLQIIFSKEKKKRRETLDIFGRPQASTEVVERAEGAAEAAADN